MASLTAFKFGDASAYGSSGRLLLGIGTLALFGPWVLAGDMIVENTLVESSIALSLLGLHSLLGLMLLIFSTKHRNTAHDYWIGAAMAMLSCLLVFAIACSRIDHFRVSSLLDARALLRLVSVHFAVINVASLRPSKAW